MHSARIGPLVLLLLGAVQAAAQPERPNILLILADDLGYTDLGAFGGEIPTPTLDALAYAGIRLTNFHTGQACQETRSMLMSGTGSAAAIEPRPLRPDGERANALRADVATMPELLRAAGYRTYMAGKWDLGLTSDRTPAARGFDRSFSLLEASSSHFAEYFWDEVSYYQEDGRPVGLEELPADFYSTRAYTDKMLEYLGEHDGAAPWFGYLTYTAPHWPLQVPDEWLDRHAGRYDEGYDVLRAARAERAAALGVIPRGARIDAFTPTVAPWDSLDPALKRRYARAEEIYAAMIELLDQQIGRLVTYLEESGQLDNTVVFFMSDHGASAAEIGIRPGRSSMPPHFEVVIGQSDNTLANIGRIGSFVDHGTGFGEAVTAPLRYYKGTVAEGGIRAAAFVHYPARFGQPRISDAFASVMDLVPTFLEIAGTSHPGAVSFNGREIQPLRGRSILPQLVSARGSVHSDDNSAGWSAGEVGAIIRGRYKLTNQPRPFAPGGTPVPAWQLYDLESDPGETTDIAGQHPGLVESLLEEWRQRWQ